MKEKSANEKKNPPILFEDKSNCCGCSACYASCPVKAISMRPDKEGFLYPEIDKDKCICCYKCTTVCAFKGAQSNKGLL